MDIVLFLSSFSLNPVVLEFSKSYIVSLGNSMLITDGLLRPSNVRFKNVSHPVDERDKALELVVNV